MSEGVLIQTTYFRQLTSDYFNHLGDLNEKISTIVSKIITCLYYFFGRTWDNLKIHFWDIKENSETKYPKALDYIFRFFAFASKSFGPPNLGECIVGLGRISDELNNSDIDKVIIRNLDKVQFTLINLAITNNLVDWNKEAEVNFKFPKEYQMDWYVPVSHARFVDIATAYLIYATKIRALNEEDKKFLSDIILGLIDKLSDIKDGPTKIPFEFVVLKITYSYLQQINDDELKNTIYQKFEDTPQLDLLKDKYFSDITTSEDYLEWKSGMILGPKLLKDCNFKLSSYENNDWEGQIDYMNISARTLQLLLFEKEDEKNADETGFYYRDIYYENERNLAQVATNILIYGIESNYPTISKEAYKIFKKLVFTYRNYKKLEKLTSKKIIDNNITHFDQHIAIIAIAYLNANPNEEEKNEIEYLLAGEKKREIDIINILSDDQMGVFNKKTLRKLCNNLKILNH